MQFRPILVAEIFLTFFATTTSAAVDSLRQEPVEKVDIESHAVERSVLEKELGRTLQSDDLYVVYDSVVAAASTRCVGWTNLRWDFSCPSGSDLADVGYTYVEGVGLTGSCNQVASNVVSCNTAWTRPTFDSFAVNFIAAYRFACVSKQSSGLLGTTRFFGVPLTCRPVTQANGLIYVTIDVGTVNGQANDGTTSCPGDRCESSDACAGSPPGTCSIVVPTVAISQTSLAPAAINVWPGNPTPTPPTPTPPSPSPPTPTFPTPSSPVFPTPPSPTQPSPTGSACYSGSSILDVKGKGPTAMENLQLGDKVLVGNGEYSQVYTFLHRDATMAADFLRIAVATGSVLEVTPKHLLYRFNHEIVTASTVKVGDDLLGPNGDALKVKNIETVSMDGVYAPATHSGTLVVSGVVGSSFPAVVSFMSAQVQHSMFHGFFAPHRLYCQMLGCTKETYYMGYNGMVAMMLPLLGAAEAVFSQSPWATILVAVGLLAFHIFGLQQNAKIKKSV